MQIKTSEDQEEQSGGTVEDKKRTRRRRRNARTKSLKPSTARGAEGSVKPHPQQKLLKGSKYRIIPQNGSYDDMDKEIYSQRGSWR